MAKHYKYIKIGLASPSEILSWSHGEVKKHETINYRTLKPEPDGLFCEKIFGPTKDYQCYCGKSKRSADKGKVCEKCGVELTESKVRRERMGHIVLASPVVHTWFLKNSPSPLAILLDIKNKDLESIVYFASYIVIDPGKTPLQKREILDEAKYSEMYEKYGNAFVALTGAEAVKKLLQDLDLQKEEQNLRRLLKTRSKQKRDSVIKRLEIVESFLHSTNKPEWMVLTILPVIPPDLRPMVQLDGGRFATTDLNDLYRRILNRNNRLKKQIEQGAPHLITKNEKRMLQEAVDALIDNSKRKNNNDKAHHLKSLSDMLRGKQGRFRQNLLGKRVDYSGRSVIVVGPSLKMYQCGIPREMALTLFKPYVIRELIAADKTLSIPSAKKKCERQEECVWPLLERVVVEHPVLLNRAPTLHRLGIQAFEPVLIEGKAIRLHPLVCTAFNADFDGDQMAVHVPLSLEAQAEARLLMLASNNILNPKDGKPVVTPSQDMVLGNYYLTIERLNEKNEAHFYRDYNEAYLAYKNGEITLHTRIFVDPSYLPATRFTNVDIKGKYLFTTIGKMIFNSIIPNDFPYLNEATNENLTVALPEKYLFSPKNNKIEDMLAHTEVKPFKKKFLASIIAEVFKRHQTTETSAMVDRLKDLGFHYSTKSGITISMSDVLLYKGKDERIAEADRRVDQIQEAYDLGLLTEQERKNQVKAEWNKARSDIESGVWEELQKYEDNAIFMMADSGSRGSSSNFAQLAGMRGLMANTAGESIEVPVKANFREGLSVSEFFISTHGSRKGSTDTALKTAESGYLTRRLVDVSQDVIISCEDCGTEKGFWLEDVVGDDGKVIYPAYERAIGRFAARDIVNPNTGEVICKRNEMVNEEIASIIKDCGINKVYMRTNLTCNCTNGVCMKCYGRNLATNKLVEVGEAVGIVAAQSIGEPGTQLTMRTFHTGGVASTADITQGLPRVQELFEARKPKGKATLAENDGTILSIEKTKSGLEIVIKPDNPDFEEEKEVVEVTSEVKVKVGDHVNRGDRLIKGPIHPKELLRIKGTEAVQKYLVEEVQKVYRSQGVEISDKHIELIVRQMLRKLHVNHEGSSDLLPGRDVSIEEFKEAVKASLAIGGDLPKAKQILLGITKAALASNSFLSACSFQETTRILTSAAIASKKDELKGLKENVIIGGLIPAGTGLLQETSFECQHAPNEEEFEEDELETDYEEDDNDDDMEEDSSDEDASIVSEDEAFNDELSFDDDDEL